MSIYHTAIHEDQLSHDLALAKFVDCRCPESEVMRQRPLKDAKDLDDLWPEMIFLVYLIFCQERGVVPRQTGDQRIKMRHRQNLYLPLVPIARPAL